MLTIEEELLSLFESAPDLIFTQDLSGRLTRVNRAFERVTGYHRKRALGTRFADYLIADDRDRADETLMNQTGGALPKADDFTVVTADGEQVRLEITWQLVFTQGVPSGWQAYARDVRERDRQLTARTLAETKLVEKSSELAKFTRHLQLLHSLSSNNYGHLEALSTSYLAAGCEIFDTSCGVLTEITGRSFTFVPPGRSDQDLGRDQRLEMQSRLVTQILTRRETLVLTGPSAADTPFAFFVGAPILLDSEAHGTITFWSPRNASAHVVAHPQGREIAELMAKRIGLWLEQRRLTDKLEYQAHHDALTGLPNRLLLRSRLEEALLRSERQGEKLAVVFLDLDRFKQINDTLGHTIGDGLLQQVANRLKACMGGNDLLARMGGDEFTAILSVHEMEDALQTVRRMLAVVRKPSNVEDFELFVSASAGVAFYPRDGRDPATLLRNADTAMYTAKYRGKNQVHCFSAEGVDSAFERLELENSLRRALEKSELKILYQPQVALTAGDQEAPLGGLEVLLVWDHPKLGRISPSQFIPIAEECGMILQIGSWVLREACAQAVRWQNEGFAPVPIAVNVSALQFAQENFVTIVGDILRDTTMAPTWLELEVTESVVMQDVEQSVSRMAELRKLGIRIAIDDFGTGYSSLSYLRRLPADTLKVDRSFLEDGGYGPGALALIQTIVILAHTMGLSVTAEGVETETQRQLVRDAGCDKAQGHLFGTALLPAEVNRVLRRRGGVLPPLGLPVSS